MRRLNIDPRAMWVAARNARLLWLPAMSVRHLVSVLALGTALPLLALAMIMAQQLIANDRHATRDGLMSNARLLMTVVDNEIQAHLTVAATLATSLALESGDIGRFKRQAELALESFPGAWINLSDPVGHVVMSTTPGVGLPTQPRGKSRLDAMASAFATGKAQVSDLEVSRITQRPQVVIEYPVFRAGVPLYSIVVGIDPKIFLVSLRDKLGANAVVGILDRQRRFVARIPDHDARLGTLASEDWRAAIERSPEGLTESRTLEGDVALTAYVPTRHGWTVGIGYPVAMLNAPAHRVLWTVGLLGLISILASLASATCMGRRMSGAMLGLVTASQELGSGDIVAPQTFSIHEATAISLALTAAAVKRHLAEATLRASEAKFHATFDNTAIGIAHVSPGGSFLEVNQTLCNILGYSAEELKARTFQEISHPVELPADLENLRKLRAGEISAYTIDKRYIRKNGSLVWTGLTVSMQKDATGAPLYFIKVVRDITLRKANQDRLQLLLRELAHRSKNQIAVIESMARLTASSATSVAEFQQVFGERVHSLAVAINMLVAGNWTGVALGDLVREQLRDFGDGRLECGGPDVTVSADGTEALGLTLHELATNSVKHGAWSVPEGVVAVSWNFEQNGTEAPSLRLRWQERNGPVVRPPARKGFGHFVIDTMIAQKLRAIVDIAFDPSGLCWTVTIPSTHLADETALEDFPLCNGKG